MESKWNPTAIDKNQFVIWVKYSDCQNQKTHTNFCHVYLQIGKCHVNIVVFFYMCVHFPFSSVSRNLAHNPPRCKHESPTHTVCGSKLANTCRHISHRSHPFYCQNKNLCDVNSIGSGEIQGGYLSGKHLKIPPPPSQTTVQTTSENPKKFIDKSQTKLRG